MSAAPTMSLETLRASVVAAFPDLAGAHVRPLTMGWDSIALEVDNRWIFKCPRRPEAESALAAEARLLAVIRTAVTMPVPDLTLHHGPPFFSRHRKLAGEHLVTADYKRLPEPARHRLAADMARFFAELHDLDERSVETAGARPIRAWLPPEDILRRAWPILPEALRPYAEETIAAWQALAPDPHGTTFGFFDGHGWNMAFDREATRLNGMYDFGDAGFGPLHQEFVQPSLISPDLTRCIVSAYERLTARHLDRDRIHLLTGTLRLSELAEYADDPEHAPRMLESVIAWAMLDGSSPARRL